MRARVKVGGAVSDEKHPERASRLPPNKKQDNWIPYT